MRKYLLLAILASIVQSCAFRKSLEVDPGAKPALRSHEFISGQWVETHDFIRLRKRDLTSPHPFRDKATSHLTCYQDGKPVYDNWGTIYAALEKKDDYYEYASENERLTLRFSIAKTDTTMSFEYKYQPNIDQKFLFSKVPGARTCDYQVTPGDGITSGIRVAYRYYYFKGKYVVTDIGNNSTMDVEMSSNADIIGLKDFDTYTFDTFGSYIRIQLFKRPEDYRGRRQLLQEFRLVPTDYGFDLCAVPKASYITTIERLYEFRRKPMDE